MFVVCDETAEQAKRTRAEKEGKVKELLKRYRDIQDDHDTLNALSNKYIGIDDETSTIEQALLVTSNCLTSVAHEIVTALQQELDADAKQLNEPESAAGGYKPLWAVVPVDGPDDAWRTVDKHYGGLRYRVFLNKEKAEEHRGNFGKVVPVWGE
jgi:hypothetical protein